MSDGLYTQLGEQGNNLSVGQKQLLALARVLVETPQVLILDEATANIDSGTEQAIQQALAKVRQHTTLVVIAHRLSTIVEADTILVLHRGQAVERGTHQQLLAAKGRYWQMYQLQLAGEELAASAREEVAQRLMHHQQAAKKAWPAVVQKRYIKCTVVVHFCAANAFQQHCLTCPLFLPSKGRSAACFHFWHSPCFISIVLAAAITEYCLEGTYEAGYRGNQTIQTGRRA